MPAVLVARELLEPGLGLLAERFEVRRGGLDATADDILRLAGGCAAIVPDVTVAVTPELLDACGPELRIVANFAVGFNNVDVDACRERGVIVTNTPDVLTNATAELALALTLAAARRMSEAEADLRAGRWSGWDPAAYLGLELSGAAIGVVGLGRIGRRYLELVAGFAGELLYASRSPKPDAERELGARRLELDERLGAADVVSLHAPATEETARLIDERALGLMRPGAVLVNTARGPLVDAGALARALREDRIGAAGLDVYEDEPRVPRALLEAPRCVLLPHIGSATEVSRGGMARLAAENVVAVLGGHEPLTRVA
jgi:lactate dehydrogenase-like 2-hydroxyacid dehydrogenase